MYQFAWPLMLLLLPLPFLVRLLTRPAAASGGGILFAPFAASITSPGSTASPAGTGRQLLWWSALLCWLLLIVAAARPQWLGEPIELPESGRNLMLAVDVSESMKHEDMDRSGATRLDVVKQVAGEFIQGREGDRVGLILFGTQAYLQAPLTFDRTTVTTFLNQSKIGFAGPNTAIGDAIGMALKRIKDTEGETVLVLLTDGASNSGHVTPDKAAELAAQQGLRIYTIGVGGVMRTRRGFMDLRMLSRSSLDEGALKRIAEKTGGEYFRAIDRKTLQAIYERLDELEPVIKGGRMVRPVDELYFWPLGAAFLISMFLALPALRREGAA